MARLNSSKIVDSDSDDELPEMSTIFSAKSIATPKKNLIPRASSLAPDSGPDTGARKPRRRVLGKATDNLLLRPLGKDSPAPEFEGRRKRAQVLGKTLFDDEDEQPRVRRGASRPRVVLRRKIEEINLEEEESEESEGEVESTYVRPRTVRRAPRVASIQQASAREQAVKPAARPKRDVLEDFGNLTLQMSDESEEEVVKPRSTRTRALRKPSPPTYVEPESSEEDENEEEEAQALAESEEEPVVESPPARRSVPMVVLRAFEPSDNEQSQTDKEKKASDASVSESEDEPPVKPQPTRRRVARKPSPQPVEESADSEQEVEEDEADVLEASCLGDDLETEPVSKQVPRVIPQPRLPSNIFNALQRLPPPKASSPAPSNQQELEDEDSEEHLNTLEVSCLEDDDEGEVEEGTAEIHEVYEHQESDEDEEEDNIDSEKMSDFIVSDGEEGASASGSDVGASEEDSPVRQAPKSVRRLVKGRKASPSPPPKVVSREPVVDFQWSDDDREEGKRPVPADVSRKLFGGSSTNIRRGLPTLSDSEEEDASPTLDPHTPSDSDNEMPAKERTPRSHKKQAEPSKRLKSPTKPKFPRLPVVSPPRRQSNDAFWEPEVINKWHDEYSPQKKLFQSPSKSAKPVSRLRLGGEEVSEIDFSKTPSKASIARAKKAEKDAIKEFEASKNRIALAFLEELDQKVTGGEIARMSESTGGVQIVWSAKLNTTAGRAHWRREGKCHRPTADNPHPVPVYNHHCSIELASKVITEEHRLINVLAHEFCHLTTFMISKELKNPHGAEFKSWGRKVEKAFKDRDVEVTTKHSYEIAWKYIWQCQSCRRDVGRHSKSVDPKRMRCGVCKGELVQIKPVPRGGAAVRPSTLFPDLNKKDGDSAFFDGTMRESSGDAGRKESAKPKQLTDYQAFVKENMARIKADNPGSPMKEVMGLVGAKYREQKAGRKLFGEGGRLKEMKLNAAAETDVEKMARRISVMDLTSP